MKYRSIKWQQGVSVTGLLFILIILCVCALLLAKVVPTVVEYRSISNAIVSAKASGTTVREMQIAFDKQRDISYIKSISSSDLEITKENGEIQISFAYQKKIALFGPASLVLDYQGTTDHSLSRLN
jgi:hypothetical protein